jgi:hypothetical protein
MRTDYDLTELLRAMGLTPASEGFYVFRGNESQLKCIPVDYPFGRVWVGIAQYRRDLPDLIFYWYEPTYNNREGFSYISDFLSEDDLVRRYKLMEPDLCGEFLTRVFG